MATGLVVGGDVEQALNSVGVPSYVLDTTGVVRWINPAAERLLGDVRGRHFTSVVAPEDSRRARELFSRKVLGTAPATDSTGVLVSTEGTRVAVEISAVPLMNGERVVTMGAQTSGLTAAGRRQKIASAAASASASSSTSATCKAAAAASNGLTFERERERLNAHDSLSGLTTAPRARRRSPAPHGGRTSARSRDRPTRRTPPPRRSTRPRDAGHGPARAQRRLSCSVGTSSAGLARRSTGHRASHYEVAVKPD